MAARQPQHQPSAERVADRVDDALGGQHLEEGVLEVVVGLGLVRLRRRAVAEQVDADHRAAGVLEQIDHAGLAPGPITGGGEAVDQQHGRRAHGDPR